MKAVKAVYRDGQIQLTEPAPDTGPVEVLVVFPEPTEDPWEGLLEDPSPRPALAKMVEKVRKEHEQGKTKPLDFDKL